LNDVRFWASEVVAKSLRSGVERLTLLISCASLMLRSKCVELSCARLGKVFDYLCLLDPKVVRSIERVLNYRANVLEALAELEQYSIWKKQMLTVYVERYGLGRFKVKKVKKKGRTYLVFERYSDSKTIIVDDPKALDLFQKYLNVKQIARDTLNYYEGILRKLAKLDDPLVVKAVKILEREALELRKRIRALERVITAG
jgi:hypothetical protein